MSTVCVLLYLRVGSDSSSKDSTLAASPTQVVAVKLRNAKLRGCNPSPQEHDEGTTKRALRKKPSQSSPSGGKFY